MANTYGSIPTASTFSDVDTDRDHVYFTRLRQLRELIKPISSFTCPSTFGEATARIKHNLSYFCFSYAMLVLLIICLSFSLHPDLMIFFPIVYLVWLLLYFCHEGPIVVFNWTVNVRIVLSVLGVLTVLFLLPYGVWLNVLVSILIGFAIVVIHAAFRGTEDLSSGYQQLDGDEDLRSVLREVDVNADDGGIPLSFFGLPPLI